MGRNKIKIERITNERTRLATFNKRKNGLVKKAMELAILCGCEVALIVIGNNKLTQYSSSDMDQLLLRYTDGSFEEPHAEPLTNGDYPKLFGKKNKGKEPSAKKPRVESPVPHASLAHSMVTAPGAPSLVKPLAVAPVPRQLADGRNSPSATLSSSSAASQIAHGASPPLSGKGIPSVPAAASSAARLSAPQQQLAPAYPTAALAGYSAARSASAQFPSQSSLHHRLPPVPSLGPASVSISGVTGRVSPPHRRSFASPGSVSPTFDVTKPRSPVSSDPPTPPGSGGQYAEEARRPHPSIGGRLLQEQQFAQKLNKKNLSLAIPDATQGNFPGSSSASHSRHAAYTPGFTGLSVPSGGIAPFLGESDLHSAVLPSPSGFFASSETPGEHHSHYLPPWGWLASPRNGELPQERFLSRDLNMALQDGTLHHQLGLTKPVYANEGAKRKASS